MNKNIYLEKIFKKSPREFIRIFRCVITRLYLRLRFVFNKINKWHFRANYYCRPYKKKIVDIVNIINPDIVVEIGCGIGDICRRLNSSKVYGIDIDKEAINIAKVINKGPNYINENPLKNKVGFNKFLNNLPESKVKVFIAVNWMHSISFPKIKEFLERLTKVPNTYLIIDKYTRGYKFNSINKKYNHNYEILFNKKRFVLITNFDEVRDLIILENKN